MNFELTISGLCVIVLKSKEERPAHPDAVDVLCVGACYHRPRLSYLPGEVKAGEVKGIPIEPDLVIDPWGAQSASLDVTQKALKLDFKINSEPRFSLTWGEEGTAAPLDESALNWVPTAEDLGFGKLDVGAAIPGGVNTRLSLPYGKLLCRNVVRDPDTNAYVLWDFPKNKKKIQRALANEVVYRARGVRDLRLTSDEGEELLSADKSEGTLYMSISNDLSKVPRGYNDDIRSLEHLGHLQAMAPSGLAIAPPEIFEPPTITKPQRTGHPICNQVLYVEGVAS